MELGSHTIAHSNVFNPFQRETRREAYPSYTLFVKDRLAAYKSSILGELRVREFLIEHLGGMPRERGA